MQPSFRTYTVVPSLPEPLQPMMQLANNLWWCWNPEAIELFSRLDRELWERHRLNPVKLLGSVSQHRFERVLGDASFMAHLDRVMRQLEAYLNRPTWFQKNFPDRGEMKVAYFSMEFGIDTCLPIYSGGLGVLAGDHMKSASDLGLPVTGVGLLYHEGYFRQYLNADGWQQEEYVPSDFHSMPVSPVQDPRTGRRLTIDVEYPGRTVQAQVWKIKVGRVALAMLDANLAANRPEDRRITAQLYGGDLEHRVKQEVLLGIGGLRALAAMGVRPTVCHMNEGHSAFLAVERIGQLMTQNGLAHEEAREIVTASNVFTTHTPVPAGNDTFPPELLDPYLQPHYSRVLGIAKEDFMGLGRQVPEDKTEPFCMTVLALKLAAGINGVSALHGKVSRKMWRKIWENLPEDEVPVRSITNGVHVPSWVSREMAQLFDRYLGPGWIERTEDASIWNHVFDIPDAELWRTHERRRERLVSFCRERLAAQLRRRGAPRGMLATADEVLDPDALTIGFARRFATYKRGTLILRDLKRLEALFTNRERPVQIIFAGKAHPRDHAGKELIQRIIHAADQEPFRRHIVFLEDYDIHVARCLDQGVDIWLNTPRRPL
jgi:glycogen phosphorylase